MTVVGSEKRDQITTNTLLVVVVTATSTYSSSLSSMVSSKALSKLPKWACYVPPREKSRHNPKSSKKKPSSTEHSSSHTVEPQSELEFQQGLIKTRYYHLQSRLLDQLLNDFSKSNYDTEQKEPQSLAAAETTTANTATIHTANTSLLVPNNDNNNSVHQDKDTSSSDKQHDTSTSTTSHKRRRLEDTREEQPTMEINGEKKKEPCPNESSAPQPESQNKKQAWMKRYQIIPPPQTTHSIFQNSRHVLPVTIWPPFALACQHPLDRHHWLECYVRHFRQQLPQQVLVWLQHNSNHHDLDDYALREQVVRQVWRQQPPPQHHRYKKLFRGTWSERLQAWAATARLGASIQVVWDPQTVMGGGVRYFWAWLVEQRCRYGIPVSVVLLPDLNLQHHSSATWPRSCAGQIHVSAAVCGSTASASQQQMESPSWIHRLVDFGLQRYERENDARSSMRVVLHWLLQNLQQWGGDKREPERELLPILLHWKREWAVALANIHCSKDDASTSNVAWDTLTHRVLSLTGSRSSSDLQLRLHYTNLLAKRHPSKELTEQVPNLEPDEQDTTLFVAQKLRYQMRQQFSTHRTTSAMWNEGGRQKVLRLIWSECQTLHSPGALRSLNELIVLVDRCSTFAEFEQCLEDLANQPCPMDQCLHRESTSRSRQVRRNVVSGLSWNLNKELPPALLKALQTPTKTGKSEQDKDHVDQATLAWALRIAPSALYETLLSRASVPLKDWFQEFSSRMGAAYHSKNSGSSTIDNQCLSRAFKYGINHLRLLGLIKEQTRGSDVSYEKIAVVFCSGD